MKTLDIIGRLLALRERNQLTIKARDAISALINELETEHQLTPGEVQGMPWIAFRDFNNLAINRKNCGGGVALARILRQHSGETRIEELILLCQSLGTSTFAKQLRGLLVQHFDRDPHAEVVDETRKFDDIIRPEDYVQRRSPQLDTRELKRKQGIQSADIAELKRLVHVQARQIRQLNEGIGGAIWRTIQGHARGIAFLSTEHLQNILEFRKAKGIVPGDGMQTAIEEELARRAIDTKFREEALVEKANAAKALRRKKARKAKRK